MHTQIYMHTHKVTHMQIIHMCTHTLTYIHTCTRSDTDTHTLTPQGKMQPLLQTADVGFGET